MANDYLMDKVILYNEVTVSVDAGEMPMNYRFDEFEIEIDTQNYRLSKNGTTIEVEPKVFDLLIYLVVNRDKLVTRDELFENIWSGQIVSDTSLSNQIKAARKAIGDTGQKQRD